MSILCSQFTMHTMFHTVHIFLKRNAVTVDKEYLLDRISSFYETCSAVCNTMININLYFVYAYSEIQRGTACIH